MTANSTIFSARWIRFQTPLPERLESSRRSTTCSHRCDRELLTLAIWDGLTTDEIAATLGLKPAAVRVATHRARQRLREALMAAGIGTGLSRVDC